MMALLNVCITYFTSILEWSSWVDAGWLHLLKNHAQNSFFSHVSINMYETQRPLLFCVVLFTVEAGKHHLFCFLFIVFICLEENKIIFHAFFTYIHLRFLQFIDQNWAISPSTKPSVSSDPVVCSIIPSWDCLGPRILGLHLSPAVLETGTEPSALRRKASGKLDVLLSGEA